MEVRPHVFRPADLVGGHVALDFSNTVTARDTSPIDWLDGYERVLEWARLVDQFDEDALARLTELNAADPRAGERALRRLRVLRETIHDVLAATLRGESAPGETIARLEAQWKSAVAAASVTVSGGRARLQLDFESSGLRYLEHELALRAFAFLQELPTARTRICAGTGCGWLFIDTSKAGRRRWCDMATCGNAAKSRRHYARSRAASRARPGGDG